MASALTFVYPPLNYSTNQIRLLKLENITDDDIKCTLQSYDKLDRPSFTALSYTWEPRFPLREILVNGATMFIGDNLWQFLRTMGDEAGAYLWIDQLCIDQENTLEKNHQVGIMATIYNEAARTIIWLGVEADASNVAMAYMRHCVFPSSEEPTFREPDRNESQAVEALFKRRYWTRLWTLQEIMYSRHILVKCAQDVLDWEDLSNMQSCSAEGRDIDAILWPYGKSIYALCNLRATCGFGRDWEPYKGDLDQVLPRHRGFNCEKPHDRVYSLLGLVHNEQQVQVDYAQSWASLVGQTVYLFLKNGDRTLLLARTMLLIFCLCDPSPFSLSATDMTISLATGLSQRRGDLSQRGVDQAAEVILNQGARKVIEYTLAKAPTRQEVTETEWLAEWRKLIWAHV